MRVTVTRDDKPFVLCMFPGYKHVETFGADAEYEEGVEVEYVTLDLGSNVHKELVPHTSEYRLAVSRVTFSFVHLHSLREWL